MPSLATVLPATATAPGFGQRAVVAAGLALLAGGALLLADVGGGRLVALWLIGGALGVALYHAAFGFGAGLRVFLREGRSAHVRAQLLMLGTAVALFFPALAAGEVFGQPVRGFVFDIGWGVAIGAFLFGIGMQLGGGCASGTLYTAGGGSTRMLVTLVFFVAGATLAAATSEHWDRLPAVPGVSLPERLGLVPALALNLALFAGLWAWAARRERRRHGAVVAIFGAGDPVRGPWPYAWAALALAVLSFATLLIAGRPWGITQAFALWGTLALDRLGLADAVFWPYWEEPTRVDLLHRSLFADVTSVMTVGVVVGAFLAAGLAGRFSPARRVPAGALACSVLGGLLLGVGAVMATGCNIGAFLSGIASGSLHGWLWILAALPGVWLGTRLRPLFGLD